MSKLREWVDEFVEETIILDGLDDCCVGIDMKTETLIYDYSLITQKFINDGMTYEEAVEYIEFNIVGLYCGDKTPIIMTPVKYDESNYNEILSDLGE